MVKLMAVVGVVVVLGAGCGGGGDGDGSSSSGGGSVVVSRDDLGEEWPLVVDEVTVGCSDGAVVVTAPGVGTFGANGVALSRGLEDVVEIQLPDPSTGAFVSVGPLTRIGLELCD